MQLALLELMDRNVEIKTLLHTIMIKRLLKFVSRYDKYLLV